VKCGRHGDGEIFSEWSHGAIAALFPNAKDQGHDLRWNAKPDIVWSSSQVPETGYSMLLIPPLPNVKERPRYSEEPAGLTNIATYALRMLQHPQPGLHLPCLDLLVYWILHPEHPAVAFENTPPVRDVH
jgi:hypothetical protein